MYYLAISRLTVGVEQQFFTTRYKRKIAPPLCHEPMLSHALAENQHRIILDMTVKTLLNYQADYQRIHSTVFDDIEQRRIYSVVQVAYSDPCWKQLSHVVNRTLPIGCDSFSGSSRLTRYIGTI
jgi:hypothetical protein